jgi:hypothetical protein
VSKTLGVRISGFAVAEGDAFRRVHGERTEFVYLLLYQRHWKSKASLNEIQPRSKDILVALQVFPFLLCGIQAASRENPI